MWSLLALIAAAQQPAVSNVREPSKDKGLGNLDKVAVRGRVNSMDNHRGQKAAGGAISRLTAPADLYHEPHRGSLFEVRNVANLSF